MRLPENIQDGIREGKGREGWCAMIKYTTLWDIMKDFDAITFTHTIDILGLMHWDWGGLVQRQILSQQERGFYYARFQSFEQICLHLELDVSAGAARRITDAFSQSNIGFSTLADLSQHLLRTLYDEMRSRLFFEIKPGKQFLVQEKHQFGKEVTLAFPSSIVDIEEAGKCLAFERNTACVFHLMRVMEVGLRCLERTFKSSPSHNPNWEQILEKCDKEQTKPFADRAPLWQSDGIFLAEATTYLRSVKVAWRNPTMHIEKVYTEEQTKDIWNAVKGFMRHLSTKLQG